MAMRDRRRSAVAAAVAAASIVPACADDGPSRSGPTTEPSGGDPAAVERRAEPGPVAIAPDHAMSMVLDALEVVGDDIFVRLRVVNGLDRFLDIGVTDSRYGPLLVMTDDLGNRYPAEAVEPIGIHPSSIGHLRLRLAGPLHADATTFSLEVPTDRGPLTSESAPTPSGAAVAWWITPPPDPDDGGGSPDPAIDTDGEPVFGASPRLPDLINEWLTNTPIDAGGHDAG